eukprot:8958284-Pyramimonas_sp.AAC.1
MRAGLGKRRPKTGHVALVASIHKNGSVEDCDSYRPISLVCVTRKLFAAVISKRLKAAGAERRLTATQFGFRFGRGMQDASFAVRRRIDQALAGRDGRAGIVALDWKKAFDSINVNAMITALGRFGLPPKVMGMVQHIYSAGRFS